jgi:membrane peptidoglycan carboxypeptidase
LDLTSAYSVFARGGTQIDPQSILEVTDANGKVLYQPPSVTPKRVFSPEISFIISHILSDNVARTMEFGPNSYLRVPGKTVAVKTGTTNDKRDNWTLGYTNDITVGVWVGNNDNTPMNPQIASGITGASPIWYGIMSQLLKKYKDGIMDKPAKVKALTIDAYLGGLPKDGYPTRSEYFIEGTEPKDVSPFYKKLKISKANGKLANEIEIKNGNFDEKDRICITENDPVSTDGKNRWQDAINAWANSQADEKYHCPTETSDASADDVVVSIKQPGDHSQNSNNIEVKAHMTTTNAIKRVEIKVNGNTVKSIDGDNRDIDETINLSDGTYQLQVVATNNKDKQGQATVSIGVNKPWDANTSTPSPTP